MVYCTPEHRFGSDALLLARFCEPNSVQKGGELHPVHCRVLYLVAKVPNSVYPKGHVLSIPEYKLDSAVRSLKRNPDFKLRYQSEALLYTDVEDIVRIASNHFIKLELEP